MEATDKHSGENATQTGIKAADKANVCHDQEPFPFLRLPPELRLMVYQFALHDITDPIMFPPSGEAQKPHPCQGALAIIHTSNFLRMESCPALSRNANRCFWALQDVFNAACERLSELKKADFGSRTYQQVQDNFILASYQTVFISDITSALDRAARADFDYRCAQFDKHMARYASSSHHKRTNQPSKRVIA